MEVPCLVRVAMHRRCEGGETVRRTAATPLLRNRASHPPVTSRIRRVTPWAVHARPKQGLDSLFVYPCPKQLRLLKTRHTKREFPPSPPLVFVSFRLFQLQGDVWPSRTRIEARTVVGERLRRQMDVLIILRRRTRSESSVEGDEGV